jgi:hypothetical protein
MLESFTNVWNMNDFMKLFAYNMWFITLVKAWWKIAEKWEVLVLQKKINNELQVLQEKWYFLVWDEFYKWNNKVQSLPADFQTLSELNKKLWYLATDTYRKPESGRAWKSINTNQVDPAKRYERLEKYSKQTVDWKISYALWDKTIWNTIQTSWLNSWKWVWEWLLKKSWFNNDEISQFKKWELKWERPVEVKALREMDKAMEVVYREYLEIKKSYLSWENLDKLYPNFSKEILQKLLKLLTKEENWKRERI